MSNPNQEVVIQRRQAHFKEIEQHLLDINRLHVLLCSDATHGQTDNADRVFEELGMWKRNSLAALKAVMGCA